MERSADQRHVRRRKTTIAAVLARRGLAVIDADGDPLLARHVDCAGNVVGDSAVPDFAWLARHSWAWNPARLDELMVPRHQRRSTSAAVRTMSWSWPIASLRCSCWRSTSPRCWDGWEAGTRNGAVSEAREYQRRKLPEYQGRLRASGAISIDARRPMDQVVDTIIPNTFGR